MAPLRKNACPAEHQLQIVANDGADETNKFNEF